MSDEEYNSDSDEDYVPSDGEAVSEEENSGDEEDLSLLKEDIDGEGKTTCKQKGKIQKKSKGNVEQRKRKGGIKLENDDDVEQSKEENEEEKARKKELGEQIAKENEMKKQKDEKKRADDLWSSFLSDVGTRPKPKSVPAASPVTGSLASLSQPVKKDVIKPSDSTTTNENKVKVTKVFDFAGEEVKITKEVDVHSKEGQEELKKQIEEHNSIEDCDKVSNNVSEPKSSSSISGQPSVGIKRPAVGAGLGGVLSKINKKQKISVLDKSKLDWDNFKQKEGISEELALHNRGKTSYIERQNFLNRTDYRQFEIEKNLRLSNSKR